MTIERDQTKRRGTAIVETAFILPFLLILILGGVDFGFQLHVAHTMAYAAGKAARALAVRGGTETQARSLALGQLTGFHATFSVTFPPPLPPNDPCDMIVRISVPRDEVALGIYELLGLSPGGTLEVKAIMRKER